MSPYSLAIKEIRFEPISALCYAFALCGVLVPLMVALSLKHGALDRTIEALVTAPSNREIYLPGSHQITVEDARQYKAIDGVEFVMPSTRVINAQANMVRVEATGAQAANVEIVPTMTGDPLLEGQEIKIGQVFVTAALAQDLGNPAVMSPLDVVFGRNKGSTRQAAIFDTAIHGMVRHEVYPRAAILVHIDDMIKVEAFRDDPNITPENWYNVFQMPSSFPTMRIYARDLASVEPVLRALKAEGLTAKPRNENVPLMLQLQRGVSIIYGLLAVMGLLGYAVAMSANLRSWTQRRRSDYSLLKLMRHKTTSIASVPLFQNLIMTFGGFVMAIILTLIVNIVVNVMFANATGQAVAIMTLGDILGFGMGLLGIVLISSLWAIKTIIDVSPGEVLTHG